MAVITLRIPLISIYLIFLAMYGCFMMITVIKQSPSKHLHNANLVSSDESSIEKTFRSTSPKKSKHLIAKSPNRIESVEEFFNRLRKPELHCRKLKEMGGLSCKRYIDNSKMVCLDAKYSLVSNTCIVYSFGVGDDTSFDDAMSKFGCEVFMFDPTIPSYYYNDITNKKKHFYKLGISTKNHTKDFHWSNVEGGEHYITGQFLTLHQIKLQLGHQNRKIDYLKLDIEGSEWEVLPHLMETKQLINVNQLAIEIHASSIVKLKKELLIPALNVFWNILEQLKEGGFMRVAYTPNPVKENLYWKTPNQSIPTCGEILFLKKWPT